MLRLSILLVFALQIAAVFCRSTADYNDETTDTENTAVSYSEAYEDNKELNLSNEMHNQSAVLQGTVLHGDNNYYYRRDQQNRLIMILVISITLGVFYLTSFILGCVCYFACNSKPRPGYIVRNLAPNQITSVQQRPGSVALQTFSSDQRSVQQYSPSTDLSKQQQISQPTTSPNQPSEQPNLYPEVQASQQ